MVDKKASLSVGMLAAWKAAMLVGMLVELLVERSVWWKVAQLVAKMDGLKAGWMVGSLDDWSAA